MTRRQSLNLIETVHVPADDAESPCSEHRADKAYGRPAWFC